MSTDAYRRELVERLRDAWGAPQGGLQFYDAVLPEVSNEQNCGRVSRFGIGLDNQRRCQVCGQGRMRVVEIIRAPARRGRGPPAWVGK